MKNVSEVSAINSRAGWFITTNGSLAILALFLSLREIPWAGRFMFGFRVSKGLQLVCSLASYGQTGCLTGDLRIEPAALQPGSRGLFSHIGGQSLRRASSV